MNEFKKSKKVSLQHHTFKNYHCPEAWNTVVVGNMGQFRLCCADSEWNPYKERLFSNWSNGTISSHFASSEMRKVRMAMLAGDVNSLRDPCQACIGMEESGGVSRRQRCLRKESANWEKESYPSTIHFELGNLCNLRCRMCNPSFSHLLTKDYAKLGWLESPEQYNSSGLIKAPVASEDFWNDFVSILPKIRTIKFTGGEPFIHPEHKKIMCLLEKEQVGHINLEYVTNLQTLVDFEAWEKFSNIKVWASIEALGEKGEYIRQGSSFEKFAKNLHELQRYKNIEVGTQTTAQIYNILLIPDLIDALGEMGVAKRYVNHLVDPNWLSTSIMPDEIKQEAQSRINAWLPNTQLGNEEHRRLTEVRDSMMKRACDSRLWEKFLKFNDQLDAANGLKEKNFKNLFPELNL